jgi:hypothetical protein
MSKRVSVTLSDELYEDATNLLCRHGATLPAVIRNLLSYHTGNEKRLRQRTSKYWTTRLQKNWR